MSRSQNRSSIERIARMGAVAALSLSLLACGGPIVFPRSAEISAGWHLSAHSQVAISDATVTYGAVQPKSPAQSAQQPTERHRGFAGAPERSVDSFWQRLLGLAWAGRLGLSYAPTYGVSLGGFLSSDSAGVEGRLQLLSQEYGAPFAAALAAGLLTPSLTGKNGLGYRFGLDISRDLGDAEVSLGAYGSRQQRQRNLRYAPDLDESVWSRVLVVGAVAHLDEWKLTLPVGAHFGQRSDPRITLGVVPEVMLSSRFKRGECVRCEARILGFQPHLAVFFTFGVQL